MPLYDRTHPFTLKRYEPETQSQVSPWMEPDDNGDYTDYAPAQQALEHLKAIAATSIGTPEHFRAVEDARLFLNGEEE